MSEPRRHRREHLQSHVMPDLAPAAVEKLLQEGARRRAVTVDTYRGLIRAIADRAGAPFATALQVIAIFERVPLGERNALFEQLTIVEQQAPRFGVSVGRFVTIMLDEATEHRAPVADS